jgi:hypothetical protein
LRTADGDVLEVPPLQEVANFPVIATEETGKISEPEPTAGELFDGNISRLGRVERDLPLESGNGG